MQRPPVPPWAVPAKQHAHPGTHCRAVQAGVQAGSTMRAHPRPPPGPGATPWGSGGRGSRGGGRAEAGGSGSAPEAQVMPQSACQCKGAEGAAVPGSVGRPSWNLHGSRGRSRRGAPARPPPNPPAAPQTRLRSRPPRTPAPWPGGWGSASPRECGCGWGGGGGRVGTGARRGGRVQ